ncbi:hypothetical protein CVT25_009597 [Psilocybe cyanescens]|uniref:Uncharacterized protein n=1 Tax=Psilocybe cyanescens TaxID=93625 RepID=A0A409XD83_PSICY|nr:hypothetical protein CVT25_009597 [Psilocybe cyanescens]
MLAKREHMHIFEGALPLAPFPLPLSASAPSSPAVVFIRWVADLSMFDWFHLRETHGLAGERGGAVVVAVCNLRCNSCSLGGSGHFIERGGSREGAEREQMDVWVVEKEERGEWIGGKGKQEPNQQRSDVAWKL